MRSHISIIVIAVLLVATACQSSLQGPRQNRVEAVNTGNGVIAQRRQQATFPAQQRTPGDPVLIARGKDLYGINCRSCHGIDLRGGDLGGPNLLRSEIVLDDLAGELIGPVVLEGRRNPGMPEMPPLALAAGDINAIAEYIHSVLATAQRQGAPPPGPEKELNILVGNEAAGRDYFNRKCSTCHSIRGDLKNIASRIPDPENLQNSWVAGRRWGPPDPDVNPVRRQVLVTVTLNNGEKITGKLGRRDDFIISLTNEDGVYQSYTLHDSAVPGVAGIEINDPLQRHRELLSEYTDEIMHDVTAYLATLK